MMLDDIYFNKIRLRKTTLKDISNSLLNLEKSNFPNHLHFLAASSLVAALDREDLNDVFNSGISICDSGPLAGVLRNRNPDFRNIRGSDFFREVIRLDDGTKGHFFIVPSVEIYNHLLVYTKEFNPKFKFTGYLVPDFADTFEKEYPGWESEILQSKSEFVWVGLGSPKQDYIAHHLHMATGRTCIALGAAIEFVSGAKPEAPRLVQAMYLEWFFRLLQDPRRLISRYSIGNFRFLFQVGKYLINLNKTS